jgi:hypothetical protein
MSGETDLSKLLSKLEPHLNSGEYVFCSLKDTNELSDLHPVAAFYEKEGLSVVIEKKIAEKSGFPYSYIASWITLNALSSLDAIGLTAVVSAALAKELVSCNVIAAYYHDHIFVPVKDKDKAMQILNNLKEKSSYHLRN